MHLLQWKHSLLCVYLLLPAHPLPLVDLPFSAHLILPAHPLPLVDLPFSVYLLLPTAPPRPAGSLLPAAPLRPAGLLLPAAPFRSAVPFLPAAPLRPAGSLLPAAPLQPAVPFLPAASLRPAGLLLPAAPLWPGHLFPHAGLPLAVCIAFHSSLHNPAPQSLGCKVPETLAFAPIPRPMRFHCSLVQSHHPGRLHIRMPVPQFP